MRPRAHLDKSVPTVQSEVPLHPSVGIEAHFGNGDCRSMLKSKAKKSGTMSFALLLRADRNTVNQQMVWPRLENGDTYGQAI